MNAFQRWVTDFGGVKPLASKLSVTQATVYRWVNRHGWPKVKTINSIVKLSKGKLTFVDVVVSCAPMKRKNKAVAEKEFKHSV